MSDEPKRGDIQSAHSILPGSSAPRAPVPRTGGPAFFVRWRYDAAREKAEAYTGFLKALTDTVNTTEALDRAIERRDLGLVRLERLPDLRDVEHIKIDVELHNLKYGALVRQADNRTALAQAEERAQLAEQRLARVCKSTVQPAEEGESPARRAAALIKRLREEQTEIIKEMREAAGDTWSEADEDTIQRMEMALQERINRIIAELRDE